MPAACHILYERDVKSVNRKLLRYCTALYTVVLPVVETEDGRRANDMRTDDPMKKYTVA